MWSTALLRFLLAVAFIDSTDFAPHCELFCRFGCLVFCSIESACVAIESSEAFDTNSDDFFVHLILFSSSSFASDNLRAASLRSV